METCALQPGDLGRFGFKLLDVGGPAHTRDRDDRLEDTVHLGGAVIVEQVFNWPGMGRMAWQAAQDRDYPVIMGIAIFAAVFVRMGSLLQSMVYVTVNPRASKE